MRRNTSRKQSTTQKQFTIGNSFCRRRRGIGACSTVLVDFSAVARHFGLPALTQYDVASAQAFCHCSATCVQNCMGLIAAVCKASEFAQVPAGLTPGKDLNFDSIADGEPVIGDLICSSQASII